jgi:hypothetical protein
MSADRPPVPPKKALGLWVSEYSYDNWAEIDNRLGTLRTNKFPVDGFVLDLRWFGGVTAGSDTTNMGKLTWDTICSPLTRVPCVQVATDRPRACLVVCDCVAIYERK